MANNHTDTSFSFNFALGENTKYTPARAKVDDSSAYMKLQSIRGFGPGTPAYTASVVREDYSLFSETWYYRFDSTNVNKGVFLFNNAYEDDGLNVKVRIRATRGVYTNEFAATGVWSPDSVPE